jgi:phosphoglycolate phosphatase
MTEHLVVFDADGVIFDSSAGIRHSLDHALSSCGLPPASNAEAHSLLGPPLTSGLTSLVNDRMLSRSIVTELEAGFRHDYASTSLRLTRLYPGITELLQRMAERGHRIAIATSKPRAATQPLLRLFELEHFFVDVECGIEAESKSDVLGRVLQGVGRSARPAVMIGDRSHDMTAAQHHGIRGLGAGWGYGSYDELMAAGADAVAAQPWHIDALIEPGP